MDTTLTPTPTSSTTPDGAASGPDSARYLESLLARMDLIAEQAIGGVGIDPLAREALELAPSSPQAQAFRNKLTLALADRACDLAETDMDAAAEGLARAAGILGTRHAAIHAGRPLSSMASAYPTLSAIFKSKRGASAPSIAAKARHKREEREREEAEQEEKKNHKESFLFSKKPVAGFISSGIDDEHEQGEPAKEVELHAEGIEPSLIEALAVDAKPTDELDAADSAPKTVAKKAAGPSPKPKR